MRIIAIALVTALTAGVSAAQQPDTPAVVPIDRVVAVVGTKPILWSEVLEAENDMQSQGQTLPTDSAARRALERTILDQLIDAEVLVQKATEEKLTVADAELAPAVDQHVKDVRASFPTEQQFQTVLQQAGFGSVQEFRAWTMEQQRRSALQRQIYQKMKDEGKIGPGPVTDSAITAYWEQNKAKLGHLPATVTFRQIVVAPKPSAAALAAARARADSILVELQKGGDFEQIAKRESMDPGTKDLGGDLGWRRRGDFLPEFEQAAFALRPGQLSPVVQTAFGFHIIRVDRAQPAEIKLRHILIRPALDSSDVARAHALADSIAALLRGGANFDSLSARFHDPVEEHGTASTGFPIDSLPDTYKAGLGSAKAGDIVTPFAIPYPGTDAQKFVILKVTERTEDREATLAELRDQIRQQLAQESGYRRFIEGLRKDTYISVRL